MTTKPTYLRISGLWNYGDGSYNSGAIDLETLQDLLQFNEKHAPIKFIVRKNQDKQHPRQPDASLLVIPDRKQAIQEYLNKRQSSEEARRYND